MTRPSVLQLGCQNPQSHSLERGKKRERETEKEKKDISKKKKKKKRRRQMTNRENDRHLVIVAVIGW